MLIDSIIEMENQMISHVSGMYKYSDELSIETEEGNQYVFSSAQEDNKVLLIESNEDDIIGGKITDTFMYVSQDEDDDKFITWTHYTIKTDRGTLRMKWIGEAVDEQTPCQADVFRIKAGEDLY